MKLRALLAGVALCAIAATAQAATVTVTGLAAYQPYQVQSGNTYTADATGTVTNVPTGIDLRDLLTDGGRVVDSTLLPSANGLFPTAVPLLHARNSDGSVLAASAASGKFGVSVSLGTSIFLISEAANSSTKTDTAMFDVVLPRNYVAGTNITLTANAQYVLGSGTVGTHTLALHLYRTAKDGTQGSDLVATSATNVAATAGDIAFTVTGTTLLPGDRLIITAVEVIQDTGGSNITSQLNSLRIS